MARVYRVWVDGEERVFACGPDQDLLAAAVVQGVRSIKRGCRGGGCGMCKVRVVDGTYDLGKSSVAVLPPAEREQGYVLACKTIPTSDLNIRVTKNNLRRRDGDGGNSDS
ncbi:MAG: 2Fe-2S iron-sulfur cluster binding domain-containing protein [Kyrpidia sp.]|nr:2Fe-2S iron-sulfur cluster binding domain-containing protein [Kyrpidia sp.]